MKLIFRGISLWKKLYLRSSRLDVYFFFFRKGPLSFIERTVNLGKSFLLNNCRTLETCMQCAMLVRLLFRTVERNDKIGLGEIFDPFSKFQDFGFMFVVDGV